MVGPEGVLRTYKAGAPQDIVLELLYRNVPVYGFAGGTNEVMRDMVAQLGMGLPRVKRA